MFSVVPRCFHLLLLRKKKRELTNEGDRVGGGRRGKRGMGGKYTEEHGRTNGGAVTNCKLIGRIYIS